MKSLWAIWNPSTHSWVSYVQAVKAVFSSRKEAKAYIDDDIELQFNRCRPVRLEVGL